MYRIISQFNIIKKLLVYTTIDGIIFIVFKFFSQESVLGICLDPICLNSYFSVVDNEI